jgi:hypothetical protein
LRNSAVLAAIVLLAVGRAFSGRDRRRHDEELAHHMPEQLPVLGEHERMGATRKHRQLPVAVGQTFVEVIDIIDRGDAVILAARE